MGSEIFEARRPNLRRHIRAIQRLSRNVNKHRIKGSKNTQRARQKLAKRHARIANIRKAYVHTLSRHVVKTHAHVALEDLHIAGMVKNHRLARSIMDAAWVVFAALQGGLVQLHRHQGRPFFSEQ